MNKTALIIGITGQDGSYLTELLQSKGYEVHGILRPVSTSNRSRIDSIFDTKEKREKYLHYADLTDSFSLLRVLKNVKPDEIYNLAAQTHVGISWQLPYWTAQTTGVGVLNLLESVRFLELPARIYQASTSELYSGDPAQVPQDEQTPFDPRSPYGTSKLFGFQICKNYRDAYGMFICNGILFNHESVRRGDNFVTKKIVNAVKEGKVYLGNLETSRDWGYSPEYVEGMWAMLQQPKPDDYVLATGETHTVREFIKWVEEASGKPLEVIQDSVYLRPQDVHELRGNPKKAKEKLGWEAKIKGKKLAETMLNDL